MGVAIFLVPCEGCCEQAMGGRSLRLQMWLGEAVTLAWHAPGGTPGPQYQYQCWYHRYRCRDRYQSVVLSFPSCSSA